MQLGSKVSTNVVQRTIAPRLRALCDGFLLAPRGQPLRAGLATGVAELLCFKKSLFFRGPPPQRPTKREERVVRERSMHTMRPPSARQRALYEMDSAAALLDVFDTHARNTSPGPGCVRRLRAELCQLSQNLPPGIFVELADATDLLVWTGYMQGPSGTAWEDRMVPFELRFPSTYPMSTPLVRFNATVFHPNVSPMHFVCMNVLAKDWSPALSAVTVLLSVQCLLGAPEFDTAANGDAATLFYERGRDAWQKHAQLLFDASLASLEAKLLDL